MLTFKLRHGVVATALSTLLLTGNAMATASLNFHHIWTVEGAGAEIAAIDTHSNRVFVTAGSGVEVRNLSTGALEGTFTVTGSSGVNSVAVKGNVVAVAAQGATKQDNGTIAFFDANHVFNGMGSPLPTNTVATGALPDMVTFSPDGTKILVANEGEPNAGYDVDPQGSITVIDITNGVAAPVATNIAFTDFNIGGSRAAELPGDVRIFGPGASVAQDLEPEYITVSPDGTTAFVTLQENNAVAKIDLATNTVTEIQALGYKDHSQPGNEFDASNKDGIIGNLQTWPVLGMYQPDGIDSYEVNGRLYYVTANEGDARDYAGFSEETRVSKLNLDPTAYPNAASLQDNANLGRLKTTLATGDTDQDGDIDQIYSYGARSFSIRDADGNLVFDSGSLIEAIIFGQYPSQWVESRSDDKGPEPETVKIVELQNMFFALVGLERTNGFMVFDITNPNSPDFLDYIFQEGDVGIEGIDFALMGDNASDGHWGWLAISNEVSNTTTLYRMEVPLAPTAALLGIGLLGLRRFRKSN